MTAPSGASRSPRLTRALLEGLPRQHFGAILADPPWNFRSYAASKNPKSDRKVKYATMKLPEIMALPVSELAAPTGCHLFLWATGPHLPQAFDVMRAWGFKYSGIAFTWIKLKKRHNAQPQLFMLGDDFHIGLGFTTRKNAEFCLLGRRGNAKRISKKVRELIIAPRREHSRKPAEARVRIEEYCSGPYLELFGRSERMGWEIRGDEVGFFQDE